MRNFRSGFFLIILSLFFSCGSETSTTNNDTDGDLMVETDTASRNITTAFNEDCKPKAKVLEGNSLLIRESGAAVFIGADSTTFDEGMGESHRLLIVMDMERCKEKDREILPVNVSPDFPYRLADISYHRMRDVIAVKGLKTVLCYDMKKQQVFGPVFPAFKNERELADAQSGNIERLEIWEDYIIGYATDLGAFVFVIEEDNSLTPFLPAVEFPGRGLSYSSLFLIPTADGRMQAIIPSMEDQPPYGFSIEALFEQALELEGEAQAIPPRFGLLGRMPAGEQVVVDVWEKKQIALPDNIKKATVEEVRKWLEEN